MIRSSVPLKPRARWSRLLAPLFVGASFAVLMVAACSVPEFEFPQQEAPGAAGEASVIPIDPCENKQLDADSGETDFDCGGACAPCAAGQHCLDVADCEADLLCHDETCIGAGCMNEAQDGAETDVDCGGDSCKPCITDQTCEVAADCEAGVCTDAVCQAPTCDDQVVNGKETSLDCGGDCSPCPVDEPCLLGKDCISAECNDGVCGAECPDGFANCDKQNDNACEVNTRTDASNCGFCGNVCELPNATAECSAGECRIKTDGCEPGFQDCNGDPADGCEVDLQTNKLNCGACDQVCPDLNGSPSCEAGQCQITCDDGFEDCDDTRDNGCEVNTKTNSKSCGACGKECPADPGYSPYCKDSVCGQTLCAAGKGDCNGDPIDACETTTSNDVNNCGGCGIKCQAVNATVACVNSKCTITGCPDPTFADCSGGYADGCETNIKTSTTHCGGCNKACSISDGQPLCDAGSCEVGKCNGTFRNCDGDPKNGCEVNIATDTQNCAGCGAMGSDCSTKYDHASSTCSASACTKPKCDAGYDDCNASATDGCEINTTSSATNCGGCGMACAIGGSAHVSSNLCVKSQCDPQCSIPYLTCDNNKLNGCEADSTSDAGNCGSCGTVCSTAASAHVDSNACVGGTCDPQCSGTYADCDGSRINGCEVDSATNANHCGGCGKVCSTAASAHVTSNACSGSTCQPKCATLYDDCDNSRLNGCEKDVSADVNNCGACGTVCGTSHAAGGTGCGGGVCNPKCDAGWGKCQTPEQGCVTALGTAQNCTKCGEVCSGSTPFCGPSGCIDHRDIVVVNSDKHSVMGWSGGSSTVAEISLTHALGTAKGSDRMLVVGVTTTENYTNPENVSVTYGVTPMLLAYELEDTGKHSYAGIYYLLDAALPTNPGNNQVLASFGAGFTWGHGGVHVMELKNTAQAKPFATGGSAGDLACSSVASRSATVTFSQPGSLVYGLIGARAGSSATLTNVTELVQATQAWNEVRVGPDKMLGAAAYVTDDDNRTMTWNVADCYNSAIAIVAIKRLNWN